MGQHYTEELETELASDIIRLFNRYNLTAPQAKSLMEKVRVLIDASETGFFQKNH